MTLWEIDVLPAAGQNDVAGQTLAADARDLGLDPNLTIAASRGFLLQGELSAEQVALAAEQLLADSVTESATVAPMGDAVLAQSRTAAGGVELSQLVHVLPKPGVMDPVALSTLQALQDMGLPVEQVSTLRKYWLPAATDPAQLKRLCQKLLFNDSIERVVTGPLNLTKLDAGSDYQFSLAASRTPTKMAPSSSKTC